MMAILTAMFFSAINQTLVSTAMPKIIAILGGMDYYSWVIMIYMLTSTIATVLVGKLSDIYGRKPFILIGIILFMIGAFLSGLSLNIFHLIAYRGIQGVGAGIIMATVTTAVGDLFSPRERGKWTGLMMSVFGISSVLGPPLGGWLVDNMDWKWLFWIFLPLGFVAFIAILVLFPKVERRESEKIDYVGSLFLSIAIVTLLLGFTWAGTRYAWGSLQIIALFECALIFILLFIIVQMKAKSPVLPLSLFRNNIITISNVAGFLMNAGMMGALIYLPFFIQGVKGISPTYSGYVTMPMSISMVVVSSIIGRYITKTGKYKRYAVIGMPIMVIGMLFMAFMNTIPHAIVAVIIFGLGLGIGMPVFTVAIQNAARPSELGVATASMQLFRNLGGTIGVAIMGTLMQSSIVRQLNAKAPLEQLGLEKADPNIAEQVLKEAKTYLDPQILLDHDNLEQSLSSLPADVRPLMEQLVEMLREALSSSITIVFLTGTLIVAIAMILTFFLKEIPLRTSNQPIDASERDDVKIMTNDESR